jgi:hypothetical protein
MPFKILSLMGHVFIGILRFWENDIFNPNGRRKETSNGKLVRRQYLGENRMRGAPRNLCGMPVL